MYRHTYVSVCVCPYSYLFHACPWGGDTFRPLPCEHKGLLPAPRWFSGHFLFRWSFVLRWSPWCCYNGCTFRNTVPDRFPLLPKSVPATPRTLVIVESTTGNARWSLALAEGLLDFLASGSSEATELLRQYVVHVIPVLNPDGAWD